MIPLLFYRMFIFLMTGLKKLDFSVNLFRELIIDLCRIKLNIKEITTTT